MHLAQTSLFHTTTSAMMPKNFILIYSLPHCPVSFSSSLLIGKMIEKEKREIKFSNSWDWDGCGNRAHFWNLGVCFDTEFVTPLPLIVEFHNRSGPPLSHNSKRREILILHLGSLNERTCRCKDGVGERGTGTQLKHQLRDEYQQLV